MGFLEPVNSLKLYGMQYTFPLREETVVSFDLSISIDVPLIISDTELVANSGRHLSYTPADIDMLAILNKYSISSEDLPMGALSFVSPGDNTDNITTSYIATRQYSIKNPLIYSATDVGTGETYPLYRFGVETARYSSAGQRVFFVQSPSGNIHPGVVTVTGNVDIAVFSKVDGTYYWKSDYIDSLRGDPKTIIITPSLQYISKDETIQFSLTAEYDDGSSEDVTSQATWGLSRNTIDEPVQELDGFTIDASGLLTAVDPKVSSIVVSAKYGGLGNYTTVFVSDYSGVYFPGGTTGAGGGSSGGGGGFGKNEVSDSIDIPSGSVAGNSASTGMFTRYLVNSSYLDAIGDWLWSTDLGLQIAKTVISAIYGNPAESVISLMSYPFNISTLSGVTSRNQNLVWGNHDSGIDAIALTSQAASVDWGTITLEEYWGNFLDYEPHTKIELYLPWGTGFVSVDPNMCLPGSIRVVTNIDFSKGSCIHNVIGNNNVVIGTYAGQCSQQVPIMSNDYASKMAGVVVSATALAVAGAAGGAASSAGIAAANSPHTTAAAYSLEQTAGMSPHSARVMAQRDAIQSAEAPYRSTQRTAAKLAAGSSVAAFKRSGIISRNGSFTDGSAALGVQYPYIILSRPSQSVPEQYGSHYGYPSNIYTRLGTIKGYTEVGEIHLNGISATDAEISELDSILKGGVIF